MEAKTRGKMIKLRRTHIAEHDAWAKTAVTGRRVVVGVTDGVPSTAGIVRRNHWGCPIPTIHDCRPPSGRMHFQNTLSESHAARPTHWLLEGTVPAHWEQARLKGLINKWIQGHGIWDIFL